MTQLTALSSIEIFYADGSKLILKDILLNVFFVYIIHAHINKNTEKNPQMTNERLPFGTRMQTNGMGKVRS